jgi:SIR2-like protein
MIGSKDIIFLLGAGASAEAGIPVSAAMIEHLQRLLKDKEKTDWTEYEQLYNHVKSAIHFSAGIKGQFDDKVPFNIETLVNTLLELERNEEHPLYPFIAAWNSRFVALAGTNFSEVRSFRRQILAALKKWMCPEDESKADYYRKLISLQQDLTHPLHIFSLNYDLCVEALNQSDFHVETGFADYGPDHYWNWERFEDSNNLIPQIRLFKLHGSINWKRNADTKKLFSVRQIETVDADKMEVIFGRDFKLEAGDPYLFFLYKFRDFTLLARLIVALGYGFGDTHINKMLTQSLQNDPQRRLLVIQRCADAQMATNKREEILDSLELGEDRTNQVIVQSGTAKEFLETPSLAKILGEYIPQSGDAPF